VAKVMMEKTPPTYGAHRVSACGDCCGGAGRATAGEAGGERAPPVGAQVRSPASAATLVAHGTFRDALLDIVHTVHSIFRTYDGT